MEGGPVGHQLWVAEVVAAGEEEEMEVEVAAKEVERRTWVRGPPYPANG